jgi:hypothetical protein
MAGMSTPRSWTLSPRTGFVVLGGPIGDGREVLLVVEATDDREVEARLDDDPWLAKGMLRIGEIRSWTIWLDGRFVGPPSPATPAADSVGDGRRVVSKPH